MVAPKWLYNGALARLISLHRCVRAAYFTVLVCSPLNRQLSLYINLSYGGAHPREKNTRNQENRGKNYNDNHSLDKSRRQLESILRLLGERAVNGTNVLSKTLHNPSNRCLIQEAEGGAQYRSGELFMDCTRRFDAARDPGDLGE